MSALGIAPATLTSRCRLGYLHPVKVGGKRGRPRNYFNPVEIDKEIERVEGEYAKRRLPRGRTPARLLAKDEAKPSPKKRESSPSPKTERPYGHEEGVLAAKAVRGFAKEGKSIVDIVIELQVPIRKAEEIWEDYSRISGAMMLSPKEVMALRGLIGWHEKQPTFRGLMKALEERSAKKASPAPSTIVDVSDDEIEEMERELAESSNEEEAI